MPLDGLSFRNGVRERRRCGLQRSGAGDGQERESNLRSWAFAGRAVEAPGVVPTNRRGSAQTNPGNEHEGEGQIAQRKVPGSERSTSR
jgi:hypothetical protein